MCALIALQWCRPWAHASQPSVLTWLGGGAPSRACTESRGASVKSRAISVAMPWSLLEVSKCSPFDKLPIRQATLFQSLRLRAGAASTSRKCCTVTTGGYLGFTCRFRGLASVSLILGVSADRCKAKNPLHALTHACSNLMCLDESMPHVACEGCRI